MAKIRSTLEQRLYENVRRLTHYAACLEQECARLGNPIGADSRNVTLRDARALIAEIKGEA